MVKNTNVFKKIFSLIMVLVLALTLASCSKTTTTVSTTKNAYEIAVDNGFSGSLDDWLKSLLANSSYKSVYDLAVDNGLFTGTLEEFIASLKGNAGSTGVQDASATSLTSTVSIYAKNTETASSFFGGTTTRDVTSAGSGIIYQVQDDGTAYIVTNYHVLYDANASTPISTNIYVFLYGMEYNDYKISATYVGGSMTYDVAVVKIQSDYLKKDSGYPYHAATLGESSAVKVGESVIAVGNPESEGLSVTAGIVSVKSESINMTAADDKTTLSVMVMRIDAAINAGNSGGGCYNASGELIGMVNAKTVSSSVEGMCYAIPISIVKPIADNIIKNCNGSSTKTIRRVYLGIDINIDSSVAVYDETTKTITIDQKIKVTSIDSNGSASGVLKANDIIINITYNGVTYPITASYAIEDLLLMAAKGDSISLYILRDGAYQTVNIQLTVDKAID